MKNLKHPRRTALVGLMLVGALGLAACGDDSDSASTATTAAAAATTTTAKATTTTGKATTTTAAAAATLTKTNFGPGCAAVPTSGAGSFSGMAADPAATAASNNPALSTLVTAVKAAGLVDTLNGPGPFTIFAPTNDAFAKIDPTTLNGVLADPTGALTKILTYHVVAGKQMNAEELAKAGTVETVEGSTIAIAADGDTIEVNGQSAVVCGNVKTANATVQIIDTVLMPKM